MSSASEVFSERVRLCAQQIVESREAALAGLFDLTAQRLMRYAVTITRQQQDAEDAVQAALVHVAASPKLLLRTDAPWPYLLSMVRNESLLILRRRKKRPTPNLTDVTDLLTYCPVDELEQLETYRQIWISLRSLPAEQSEVIVLKTWEEMTFAQIGEMLDVSAATAASRYRYGIEKLSAKIRITQPEVMR